MAIEYTPQYSLLTTVTNAGTFAVQVTSLPALAVGSIISVSGLTSAWVSVNNLVSVLATVTNAGVFAISSLPAFAVGAITSISNNAIVQIGANTDYWSFTSTYTSAQTNVVIKSEPSSTTAYYVTDIIFSNNTTQGNISLIESRPNAAIKVKIADLFFAPNGGAVSNFRTPIVFDTNAAIAMTSKSVTAHSITVVGYIV